MEVPDDILYAYSHTAISDGKCLQRITISHNALGYAEVNVFTFPEEARCGLTRCQE